MSLPVVWSDQWLVCADGTELVSRVWQPAGDQRWPVLLMRQPYGRAIASTPTYAHPSWYAAQGFVVVVQDVRGCGDSGGVFGGFAQEASDSAATVLWARGLPGSNGRLGCYGFSYQGLTQLLNQDPQQRPEALPDALAPAMCGLDAHLHWSSSGGAHWWALGLAWGLQLAALQCRRRGDHQGWRAIRRSLASQACFEDGLELLERLDPDGMVLSWLRQDPESEAEAGVGLAACVDPQIWQRPMLLIGGWYDPHLEGILDLLRRVVDAGATPWLRIGAWTHLHWRGGVDRLQLAFFNHHLKNQPAAVPVQLLQDLVTQQWLPTAKLPSCTPPWWLCSDGLATAAGGDGVLDRVGPARGTVIVVHDPWRPMAGRGGHLGLDAGPIDRADLDQRRDVACFSSAVLDQSLMLCGRPCLTLVARADQDGFDLCVALSRERADGAVDQLSTGVLRCLGPGCRLDQPRQVLLQAIVATLEPGDRLRLAIALAAWPQITVNPGTGDHGRGGVGPQHRVISVTLTLDAASLCIHPVFGAN